MKLEKLKREDIPEVYEIEKLSFAEPHSVASMAAAIMNPACEFWVARDENKIIGFIEFWLMYDESHVIDIAVRPEYRRKGIGKYLMEFLVEKSAEAGAKKIFLEVRPSNTPARSLYKKMGFVESGRRTGYYKDEDAIIMSKNLVPDGEQK